MLASSAPTPRITYEYVSPAQVFDKGRIIDVVQNVGQEDYRCGLCGFKGPRQAIILYHIETRHQIILCPGCDFIASSFTERSDHILLVHSRHNEFVCSYCPTTKADICGWVEHVFHHFINTYDVDDNILTAFRCPRLLDRVACHLCGLLQVSEFLDKHLEQSHDLFACYMCDYRPASRADRLMHVQDTHTSERGPKCSLCDFVGSSAAKVREHFRCHLLGVEGFRRCYEAPRGSDIGCCFCNWTFVTPQERYKHFAQRHLTPDGAYFCPLCGVRESSYLRLIQHGMWHRTGGFA